MNPPSPKELQELYSHNERAHEVENVETRQQEGLPVPSRPPLETAIQTRVFLRDFIEAFTLKHGTLLDIEADFEEGRESVGEVADAEGANKGC